MTVNSLVRAIATSALVFAAAGLTVGCNNKVAECNKLIEMANTEGEKMGQPGGDAASLKKMADDLDAAAKKLGEVPVTLPELVTFRDDLKKQYTEVAGAARDAADAIGSNNLEKANGALAKFTAAETANAKLVSDINKFCQE